MNKNRLALFLKTLLQSRDISLNRLNLILAIWIGGVFNFAFLARVYQLTPYSGYKSWLFIMATAAVLVALYYFIFQLIHWRWSVKVLGSVLLVIGGMSAYFVSSLGVVITPDQVQNVMQTDSAEARDLMSWHMLLWALCMVILPVMLLLWVRIKPSKIFKQLQYKMIASVAAMGVIAVLLFTYYVDYAAIFRENRDLKGMISPQNTIASTYSYFHKKAPKKNLPFLTYGEDAHRVEQATAQQKPKLMLLVVGETARAESFGLNGYNRDTNPELSKQADLINFNQVSSCGTATAVSLPCMFSGMPRQSYDEKLAVRRESLLDLAQRAGYKVTWIENNSGCKGACDRVENYVIPEKIKQKWCSGKECLDGILVDTLNDYIAQIPADDKQPRLIVMHQLGSHGPAYYKRAPSEFQRFKPSCDSNAIQGCSQQQLVNVYDNSIVYTDHILNQSIEVLKKQDKYRTGFWYISDHGESTGERGMYLHGAPYAIAPKQQTHIPMMMWFSPQWTAARPEQVQCLSAQRSSNLSQDELFPSLLALLDVQSKVIDPRLNMLQRCNSSAKV